VVPEGASAADVKQAMAAVAAAAKLSTSSGAAGGGSAAQGAGTAANGGLPSPTPGGGAPGSFGEGGGLAAALAHSQQAQWQAMLSQQAMSRQPGAMAASFLLPGVLATVAAPQQTGQPPPPAPPPAALALAKAQLPLASRYAGRFIRPSGRTYGKSSQKHFPHLEALPAQNSPQAHPKHLSFFYPSRVQSSRMCV
jgi:hypothetical protein